MNVNSAPTNTSQMKMHRLKQKHGIAGKIDEIDLGVTDIIMYQSSRCLNCNDQNRLPSIMRPNPNDSMCLTSDPDVDCQMMIKLVFRDPVSLTHILIRATKAPNTNTNTNTTKKTTQKEDNTNNTTTNNNDEADANANNNDDHDGDDEDEYAGPRLIKLFTNRPELDFTDAEDLKANQQIVCSVKHLNGKKITLKSLKFQRVSSLQIFVVDNQNDSEVTFINRIGLIGRLSKAYHTQYHK